MCEFVYCCVLLIVVLVTYDEDTGLFAFLGLCELIVLW